MKKILVISLAGLALVLAGCSFNTPNTNQAVNQTQPTNEQNSSLPPADQNQNVNSPVVENNTANTVKQQVPTSTPPPSAIVTTPAPIQKVVASDLWSIFDQLNKALKDSDVAAYNAISYIQVPTAMAGQFSEFAAYSYKEDMKLNKSDFVNKWQDDKQAIYSTNPVREDTADSYGYKQAKITFIKDNGSWKILSISPFTIGWLVLKSDGAVQAEKELQAKMLDSDKDGLTNQDETCSGWQEANPNCVKTDPNKRDTNNNGWWDGIEKSMK